MIDLSGQNVPLDQDAYRHQLLLLKSAHCGRPVVHEGLNQFINSLTLYQDGGRVGMIVYLAGKKTESTARRSTSNRARTTSPTKGIAMPDNLNNLHVDGTPIRRPLAHRIAQELRHLHPCWTEDEIVAEAKAQAIAQLRGKEQVSYA